MKPPIPWLRVFVEGVVIVGSILLAFGIDAAWEGRQEREEEHRLLQDLQHDFIATRELLASGVAQHERTKILALEVAEYGVSGGSLSDPAFLDDLRGVMQVFVGATATHPKTAALDGALASGQLDLVSNDQLRSVLAGWPGALEEFTEQERDIAEQTVESRRALANAIPIADQVLEGSLLRSLRASRAPVSVSPELVAFVTSALGQNHAAFRARDEALAERDGVVLLAEVDEILRLLALELE